MTHATLIGSGLSCLLIAQSLLDEGFESLTVIEPKDPLAASNAPLALCHPFPGRTLQPHPLLDMAYSKTMEWMHRWGSWDPTLVQSHPITSRKSLTS